MPEDGAGGAVFVGAFVGLLVEELPLCGETVLRPRPARCGSGALARAVEPVLERGEGDGVHWGRLHWASYPSRNGLMISNPSMIWPCCMSSV